MLPGQIDMFGAQPAPQSEPAYQPPKIGRAKTMMKTREKLLGVSGKTLAARTMRTVNSIRAQAVGIGAAFEDIDNTVTGAAEVLMQALEEFERTVSDAVEYLKEEPEDDL